MVRFFRANAVAPPLSPDPGTLEGALMNNHMPRRLVSDPRLKGTGRSGGFVESLLDVARDRLSAFAGHLLAERSQLFGLLTQHLELLTGVRGQHLGKIGGRLSARELASKLERGLGVGLGHIDYLVDKIIILSAVAE